MNFLKEWNLRLNNGLREGNKFIVRSCLSFEMMPKDWVQYCESIIIIIIIIRCERKIIGAIECSSPVIAIRYYR